MKKYILLTLSFILVACDSRATVAPVFPTDTAAPTVTQSTATATVRVPTEMPTFTLTPSPTAIPSKISIMDGMTQVYIPAGLVHMGGRDVLLENDELPAHDVQISAFWMDQVEVTNGMYGLCVNAGVCRLPVKLNSDNRGDYFGNPEFQDYPVVYVSWLDANTYCQWAGRRLPTEAEWERAARADTLNNYPWGSESPTELYANANNTLGDTSRVGSYSAGMSPFGVLDMAGNVWEWVNDYYKSNYYANSPSDNPTGPEIGDINFSHVMRGGSYQDNQIGLRVSNRGYAAGPNPSAPANDEAHYGFSSVKVGFRCAQSE